MAATVNTRTHQAFHGGATSATANINGIAAGGLMSANLQFGYENTITAPADGLSFPEVDRLTQYCRGSITCQDWPDVVNVLNGTVGTYVFYERESGTATATIWTITAPVIHTASFNLTHRGFGTCSWSFECKAANTTAGFADMLTTDSASALPAAALAVARGIEITGATHATSATPIYHITGLSFNVAGNLIRASQDGDVGYTAVDVIWGGSSMGGTITFQDSEASDAVKAMTLLGLAEGDLTVTVKQAQGAANKTLVLKNCIFTGGGANYSNDGTYAGYSLDYVINGDQGTPIGTAADKPYSGDTAGITIT